MKVLIFVSLFLFSSLNAFTQIFHKLPNQLYSNFTHKEKYYFLSQDSTYETSDAVHWKIYPNKIPAKGITLYHHNTDSCTYVYYASGGNFYKFDGDTFTPMYQLGNHQNQYGSATFVYNKQIHLFGGYGLFTLKNIITYFDMKTQEWDVEDCYDPYHDLPLPRSLPLAQVNQNNVFIGGGYVKNLESDGDRQARNLSQT